LREEKIRNGKIFGRKSSTQNIYQNSGLAVPEKVPQAKNELREKELKKTDYKGEWKISGRTAVES